MTPHTEIFTDLLRLAVESGASDIVIKSNKPGFVRLSGRLKPVDMDAISASDAASIASPSPLRAGAAPDLGSSLRMVGSADL